jgi:peptidoglycan hydrolase CwlO-like protein
MIHETIDRLRIEVKRDQLETQFNELQKVIAELTQKLEKVKADAIAVNGAHQVCQQILTEATKDDDNTGVDVVPEKVDDAPEEKQRDERFVEEEQK